MLAVETLPQATVGLGVLARVVDVVDGVLQQRPLVVQNVLGLQLLLKDAHQVGLLGDAGVQLRQVVKRRFARVEQNRWARTRRNDRHVLDHQVALAVQRQNHQRSLRRQLELSGIGLVHDVVFDKRRRALSKPAMPLSQTVVALLARARAAVLDFGAALEAARLERRVGFVEKERMEAWHAQIDETKVTRTHVESALARHAYFMGTERTKARIEQGVLALVEVERMLSHLDDGRRSNVVARPH